jgi:hypothetical protein
LAAPADDDLRHAQRVLGRSIDPQGVIGVVRGAGGRTLCLMNAPWRPSNKPLGVPLPTLFWLVDEQLMRQLGELERRGGVKACEAWVAADALRLAALAAEHAACAAWRAQCLPSDAPSAVAANLLRVGVGGIAHPAAVKCLHLFAAWHLGLRAHGRGASVVATWLRGG